MLLLLHYKLGKAPTFKKKKKKAPNCHVTLTKVKETFGKKFSSLPIGQQKKSLTSFQQKFLSLPSQKSKTNLFITDFIV